jgi:hypothetical protein
MKLTRKVALLFILFAAFLAFSQKPLRADDTCRQQCDYEAYLCELGPSQEREACLNYCDNNPVWTGCSWYCQNNYEMAIASCAAAYQDCLSNCP